jgi:Holliday junction resolvase
MVNSRRKGKEGELALAKILRERGYDARRGQQFKGGADSPDVIGLPGIHIECKRVERLDLAAAYEQSFRDAADGEIAAVFHKKNREPWMVTVSLEDFFKLYEKKAEF